VSVPAAIELDGQYRMLREEQGLLDRSGRAKLLVRGADGAEYLQGQLTNDIEALAPGEGCYAALLDRKGHLQSDLRVLRLEEDLIWIDFEPEPRERVLRHLRMYSVGREVAIEDASEGLALLSVIGPEAVAASRDGGGVPALHSVRSLAGSDDAWQVGTADGYDVICRAAEAGRHRGDLPEVSEEAAEILRIERGVPRFGREMTEETMPAEAGIVEQAVSFTKGCYIGQETVARLHYRGKPNRHLRGLRFGSPATPGAELHLGERRVGTVGSTCVSPVHGPIGLAILRREAEPGSTLAVEGEGASEVVELPFGDGR
jgi:folate-binding protein YgfZ